MIITNECAVTMPKKYKRIYQLLPAYRSTFVLLVQKQLREDCLVHVDSSGKILFEYSFKCALQGLAMVKEYEAVILDVAKDQVLVFNLRDYSSYNQPHFYISTEANQSRIHSFSDTGLICVQELGRYGDNRYVLTYYDFSEPKKPQKRTTYSAKDDQWTFKHISFRANNHSMMCWYAPLESNFIRFRCFDIKKQMQSYQIRTQNLENVLCSKGSPKLTIGVNNIWEWQPNIFFIICLTNQENIDKKRAGTVYLLFDSIRQQVREPLFSFGLNQDFVIMAYSTGKWSVFLTFEDNERIQVTPLYYVDHLTEEVAGMQTWECSQRAYTFPGHNGNIACEGEYALTDVDRFHVCLKKVLQPKEMYLLLLVEMNWEFDEDLLLDTLKALQYCNDIY